MNDKEVQQIIKKLEDKIKRLEKSNRNWRRKCQRLINKNIRGLNYEQRNNQKI